MSDSSPEPDAAQTSKTEASPDREGATALVGDAPNSPTEGPTSLSNVNELAAAPGATTDEGSIEPQSANELPQASELNPKALSPTLSAVAEAPGAVDEIVNAIVNALSAVDAEKGVDTNTSTAVGADSDPDQRMETVSTPVVPVASVDDGPETGSSLQTDPSAVVPVTLETIAPAPTYTHNCEDLAAAGAYLDLPPSALSALSPSAITLILTRAREASLALAQRLQLEVSLESSTHQNQAKLSAIRKQYMAAQKELTQLKSGLATLSAEKEALSITEESLRSELSASKAVASTHEAKLTEALDSKRTALEILTAREGDIRILKQEIDQIRVSMTELRHQAAAAELAKESVLSENLKMQFTAKTTAAEMASCQKNLAWHEKVLATKAAELLEAKHKLNATEARLGTQLDRQSLELQAAKRSCSVVTEKLEETTAKLDAALVRLKAALDNAASESEAFMQEMAGKTRLVELYKKSSEDRKNRIVQLEESMEAVRATAAADVAEAQAVAEAQTMATAVLEEKVKTLEETVHSLSDCSDLPLLSASAKQTASAMSGVSLTQLYADFGILKKQLVQERWLKETLQTELDAFVAELEARAPSVEASRQRIETLESELAQLAQIAEHSDSERQNARASLQTAQNSLRSAKLEISYLVKQKTDLARQVQSLLIQITVGADNQGALTNSEKLAISQLLKGEDVVESDTDRLISERLVTFSNVVELQARNEELLKVTRQLGAKLEQQDEAGEAEAVEEAREAIMTLQEDIESLKIKLDAVTNEREMYKALAKQEEGVESAALTVAHAAPVEAVGEASMVLLRETQQAAAELAHQLAQLGRENASLSVEVARATSSAELAEERLAALRDSFRYAQQELDGLRVSSSAMSERLDTQEAKSQSLTAQLIEVTHAMELYRSENTNLKAEKSLWKTIEVRLQGDYKQLLEERNQLVQRVSGSQRYSDDREQLAAASHARLTAQIEALNSDLRDVRARVQEKEAELKEAAAKGAEAARVYQLRIDALVEQSTGYREQVAEYKAKGAALLSEVAALKCTLEGTDLKLSYYTKGDESVFGSLDATRAELAAAQAEVLQCQALEVAYQNVAKGAEEALASMNATFEEYKKVTGGALESAKAEQQDLQAQVTALTAEVQHMQAEEAKAEAETQRLKSEMALLQTQVDANDAARAEANAQFSSLQTDLKQQVAATAEAHTNYERELQKHAEVAKTVTLLRAQVSEVQAKLLSATATAKTVTQTLEASEQSWEEQKTALEEQARDAQSRANDLVSQNQILHAQLEAVGKHEPSGEGMGDVVTFLRREKESSDAQLGVAVEECGRLRAKMEATVNELHIVQTELAQARARDANAATLSAEHERLMEQINQMNLLRESNTTLRAESKQRLDRVVALEAAVAKAASAVEPLETEVARLQAEVGVKDQQLRLGEEEVQRWKQKAQDVLLRINKIDPEVHEELKARVKVLEQQVETLTQELQVSQAALTEAKDAASKGAARVERMKAEFIQKLKQSKADAAAVAETKEGEITKLKGELEARENQATLAADAQVSDIQAQLAAAQKELATMKEGAAQAPPDASIDELNELKANHAALQSQLAALEAEASALKAALASTSTVGEGEGEGVNPDVEGALASMKAEFEAQRAELTASFNKEREALTEQVVTQEAELKAKEVELANRLVIVSGPSDTEAIQTLEAKHAAALEAAVKTAIEDTKARVRAPVEAKVQSIAEARFLRFKKEEEEKAASREADKAKADEVRVQKAIVEAVEKVAETSQDDLVKQLTEAHKATLSTLTEEYEAKTKRAAEEARANATKMAEMRMKILQSKLEKALKEVDLLKTPAAGLPQRPAITAASSGSATGASRIPQISRPQLNRPTRGGFQAKRAGDFKSGPAKKQK